MEHRKMNLETRRAEISAILAEIETSKDRLMHMPETDAAEAIEIIERIERKLFPAGMPR
jgi:hypothetical protein